MKYTGIDSGISGAIATLTDDYVFCLRDIPLKDGWYDHWKIDECLRMGEQILGLEDSSRFPKLTKGIGVLWTIASLNHQIQVHMVWPQQWQKWAGIKRGEADKNRSLAIAREMFPGRAEELSLKKHHNRAESLIIAAYMRSEFHV